VWSGDEGLADIYVTAPDEADMNGDRFGRLFQVTTYGESHGRAMGVTISGCPAGLPLDSALVQTELDRRKPGQSMITTSRGEPDAVTLNSGVQDGVTTGTPIGMVIENKDARSKKYEPYVTAPRPSHGDFTYSAKFGTRNWAVAVDPPPARPSTGWLQEQSRRRYSTGSTWRWPHMSIRSVISGHRR